MLQNGADPNSENDAGKTALLEAIEAGQAQVVALLLDWNADPNKGPKYIPGTSMREWTPLHVAVEKNNAPIVELLLGHNADRNVKSGWYADTALSYAASLGHTAVMAALIADDPTIHSRDSQDSGLALGRAVHCAMTDAVRLILGKGANPNESFGPGTTFLMEAALNGHQEIAHLLLSNGADPAPANDEGYTALHFAAKKGHTEIAECLLKFGASPNAKSRDALTPLMEAARFNHADIVRLMLKKRGVNPDVKKDVDWSGQFLGYTALDFAKRLGHKDVVALLTRPGAK